MFDWERLKGVSLDNECLIKVCLHDFVTYSLRITDMSSDVRYFVLALQCITLDYITYLECFFQPHYIISSSSQVGDRLSLIVEPDQSLVFYLNQDILEVSMADIPHGHGLYGFVDLWAKCTSVKIIPHPIQVPPNFEWKTSTLVPVMHA